MKLINDHFQNRKRYNIPKANLVIADIPYNLGNNAYASSPQWYKDGDRKNGESKLANKQFFDTDKSFNTNEFFHFCSKLIISEPKETGKAGCMIVFCAFEQMHGLIEAGKKHGFKKYINLCFYKNYSPQVLKANVRIVGNTEYALLFYREKLPKFNNNGKMMFNSMPMSRDTETEKIHPCLPKGEKVFFNKKWINIEDVKIGDKNRYGKVIATTKHDANKIIEIKVNNFITKATWNHPFLIKRNNKIYWANAEKIKKADFILTGVSVYAALKQNKKGFAKCLKKENLQKKDILDIQKIKMENLGLNIISFGKIIMGKFLSACKYIIMTLTKRIIVLKICDLSVHLNTKGFTQVADLSTMNGRSLVKFAMNIKDAIKKIGIILGDGLMGKYARNVFVKNKSKTEKFVFQKVGSVSAINKKQKVYNLTMDKTPAFDTFVGVSHNTQKPIETLKHLIRLFTDKNDIVIDPCAGSGSTLIASEILGRRSFGFEIKKEFCEDFKNKLAKQLTIDLI